MSGLVQRLPIAFLEAGGMDSFGSTVFRTWREHRGRLGFPPELLQLSTRLILTAGEAPKGDSPNILCVGADTLFARLCPEAVDTENFRPRDLIDTDFRSAVHAGYHEAIDEGVSYQRLTERCYPRNAPADIDYERVIVRWTLRSGLVQLTTYVKPLDIRWQISPPNPLRERGCSSPSPNLYQSLPEQYPIGCLSDARM